MPTQRYVTVDVRALACFSDRYNKDKACVTGPYYNINSSNGTVVLFFFSLNKQFLDLHKTTGAGECDEDTFRCNCTEAYSGGACELQVMMAVQTSKRFRVYQVLYGHWVFPLQP